MKVLEAIIVIPAIYMLCLSINMYILDAGLMHATMGATVGTMVYMRITEK